MFLKGLNNMKVFNGVEYWNEKEVANYIGYSRSWMKNMRHLKKGMPFIKILGRIYYSINDVKEWIKNHTYSKSFD